ncbi:MAG: GGDEF domain-containing protein [Lachnospiraceae bacterium]|nr:GGDEF domain-containing protein [Lachnospiraceae bacterium]
MNKERDKFAVPYLIVIGICMIVLFCFVSFFTDFRSFFLNEDPEGKIDFSQGWLTDTGEEINIFDTDASIYGDQITLTKSLPDDLADQTCLAIVSLNAKIDITVGSKDIYQFDSVPNLIGSGSGVNYHTIYLSDEDAGKEITITLSSVFTNYTAGRLNEIFLCAPSDFVPIIVRSSLFAASFSFLVIFFGILMLIIHFLIPKGHTSPYHLASLGNALILIGIWCLIDTELPQLLTGCIYGIRVLDYTLLPLAIFPLLLFVISLTQKRRPVYVQLAFWIPVLLLSSMFFVRFTLGTDMHDLSPLIYGAYALALILALIILLDNEHYCRVNRTPSGLGLFYIGLGFLTVCALLDILIVTLKGEQRMPGGYGHFLRYGMIIFLLTMVWQVLRWWTDDRASIERERVVNKILQCAMGSQGADTKIKSVLEYLCIQLHADRACVFEDQLDGTFANTYEWCRPGAHPQIANLQEVPYDGLIEIWYDEFKKDHHIAIEDLEKYRPGNETMYNWLKPQDIQSLITGPLVIEGKYVGFFGLVNLPAAFIKEAGEIMGLLSYVFAQIISQRDEQNTLLKNSYSDEMTGVKNRRALDEFEANERDTTKPFGYIVCDLNGLKIVNDTIGHNEGDNMIIDVANALAMVFGAQNVFRNGGDEFVVYDYADNETVFENEVKQLHRYVDRKKRSVSIGAIYCKEGCADMAPIKTAAAEQLYTEKKKFFNGRNDRRSVPRG